MMKMLMLCQALARGRFQQPEIEPPEEDLNRVAASPAHGAGLDADPTPIMSLLDFNAFAGRHPV